MVLKELQTMVQEWVARCWVRDNPDLEKEKYRGAKLFVSGSYRLGVNDADGDIDTMYVHMMAVAQATCAIFHFSYRVKTHTCLHM